MLAVFDDSYTIEIKVLSGLCGLKYKGKRPNKIIIDEELPSAIKVKNWILKRLSHCSNVFCYMGKEYDREEFIRYIISQ